MNYEPQPGMQPNMMPGGYAAPRSGTPKVIGILMIVFASIGLLFTLIGFGGPSDPSGGELKELKTLKTISTVFGVLGLALGALHLIAGIQSVKYKASAPKLAVTYGIASIAHTILNIIVVFAWLKPKLAEAGPAGETVANALGAALVIVGVLQIIWPTVVLALMTRPAAKAACVN